MARRKAQPQIAPARDVVPELLRRGEKIKLLQLTQAVADALRSREGAAMRTAFRAAVQRVDEDDAGWGDCAEALEGAFPAGARRADRIQVARWLAIGEGFNPADLSPAEDGLRRALEADFEEDEDAEADEGEPDDEDREYADAGEGDGEEEEEEWAEEEEAPEEAGGDGEEEDAPGGGYGSAARRARDGSGPAVRRVADKGFDVETLTLLSGHRTAQQSAAPDVETRIRRALDALIPRLVAEVAGTAQRAQGGGSDEHGGTGIAGGGAGMPRSPPRASPPSASPFPADWWDPERSNRAVAANALFHLVGAVSISATAPAAAPSEAVLIRNLAQLMGPLAVPQLLGAAVAAVGARIGALPFLAAGDPDAVAEAGAAVLFSPHSTACMRPPASAADAAWSSAHWERLRAASAVGGASVQTYLGPRAADEWGDMPLAAVARVGAALTQAIERRAVMIGDALRRRLPEALAVSALAARSAAASALWAIVLTMGMLVAELPAHLPDAYAAASEVNLSFPAHTSTYPRPRVRLPVAGGDGDGGGGDGRGRGGAGPRGRGRGGRGRGGGRGAARGGGGGARGGGGGAGEKRGREGDGDGGPGDKRGKKDGAQEGHAGASGIGGGTRTGGSRGGHVGSDGDGGGARTVGGGFGGGSGRGGGLGDVSVQDGREGAMTATPHVQLAEEGMLPGAGAQRAPAAMPAESPAAGDVGASGAASVEGRRATLSRAGPPPLPAGGRTEGMEAYGPSFFVTGPECTSARPAMQAGREDDRVRAVSSGVRADAAAVQASAIPSPLALEATGVTQGAQPRDEEDQSAMQQLAVWYGPETRDAVNAALGIPAAAARGDGLSPLSMALHSPWRTEASRTARARAAPRRTAAVGGPLPVTVAEAAAAREAMQVRLARGEQPRVDLLLLLQHALTGVAAGGGEGAQALRDVLLAWRDGVPARDVLAPGVLAVLDALPGVTDARRFVDACREAGVVVRETDGGSQPSDDDRGWADESTVDREWIHGKLAELIAKGVVVPGTGPLVLHPLRKAVKRVFCAPKDNGGAPRSAPAEKERLVVDMHALNQLFADAPMSYPGVKTIAVRARAGDYMAVTDVAAGYHTVGLSADAQRLFAVEDPVTRERFVFTALPFGWSLSAYAFQTVSALLVDVASRHVQAVFPAAEVRASAYLDDIAILAREPAAADVFLGTLVALGVPLAERKTRAASQGPTRYLGLEWDFRTSVTVQYPKDVLERTGAYVRWTLDAQAVGAPLPRMFVESLAGKVGWLRWALPATRGAAASVASALRHERTRFAVSVAGEELGGVLRALAEAIALARPLRLDAHRWSAIVESDAGERGCAAFVHQAEGARLLRARLPREESSSQLRELYGLYVAVFHATWPPGAGRIEWRSDSAGAMFALARGNAPDRRTRSLLRLLIGRLTAADILIECRWRRRDLLAHADREAARAGDGLAAATDASIVVTDLSTLPSFQDAP